MVSGGVRIRDFPSLCLYSFFTYAKSHWFSISSSVISLLFKGIEAKKLTNSDDIRQVVLYPGRGSAKIAS